MKKILKAEDLDHMKIVRNGCMITHSGIVVDLMDPDPDSILIQDIAHGLANNCRWNGHTQKFWSVAQHCCMMADQVHNRAHKLTHLFHDAEEAYWGDIIKPLKNIIEEKCPEITERMEYLRKLIFYKFHVPPEGVVSKQNDWECLCWEFENIIKHGEKVVYWSPTRAEREWTERYESIIFM